MKLAKTHLAAFKLIAEHQPVHVVSEAHADYRLTDRLFIPSRTKDALWKKGLLCMGSSRSILRAVSRRRRRIRSEYRRCDGPSGSPVLGFRRPGGARGRTSPGGLCGRRGGVGPFEALRSQDVSRLPHDDAAADLAAFLAEQEDGR